MSHSFNVGDRVIINDFVKDSDTWTTEGFISGMTGTVIVSDVDAVTASIEIKLDIIPKRWGIDSVICDLDDIHMIDKLETYEYTTSIDSKYRF